MLQQDVTQQNDIDQKVKPDYVSSMVVEQLQQASGKVAL